MVSFRLESFLIPLAFCIISSSLSAAESSFQGACDEADLVHLYKENHDFAKAWDKCGKMSGLDLTCFDREYPNQMSDNCLECFNQMTKCAVNSCAFTCMFDRRGEPCRRCTVDNCGEELYSCAGISQEQLPDFKRKLKH